MQLLSKIIKVFLRTLPLLVLIQSRLLKLFAQAVYLALKLLFIIILACQVIMSLANGFLVFFLWLSPLPFHQGVS